MVLLPLSYVIIAIACVFFITRVCKRAKANLVTATDMNKTAYIVIFSMISIAALLLRTYHLGLIPFGINCDEAGSAYDAFCIGNYGTDRYCYPFPIYFVNYAVGQNALYTYLLVPFIRLFGNSVTVYRIPAVIGGMMTFVFGAQLSRKAYGKRFSLVTALLIAICPYFIMSSRRGYESMLLLSFSTMSIFLLYYAVSRIKCRYFVLAGISFGLCLYCYSLSWVIIPSFLVIILIYLIYLKKITIKQILAFIIPLFILALPLLTFVYVNSFGKESIITSYFSIIKLPCYRSGEFGLQYYKDFFNRIKTLLTCDALHFFSFKECGSLYMFSIPFILLGFVTTTIRCINSIRKKIYDVMVFIYAFFIASLIIVLILEEINIGRCNEIYLCFVFFLTAGIQFVIQEIPFKKIVSILFCSVYLFNIFLFSNYYLTGDYKEDYPVTWFDFDYTLDFYEYLHDNNVTCNVYFDDFNVTTYCVAMLEYEIGPYDYMSYDNNELSDYCNYDNLRFYLPSYTAIDPDAIYVIMRYNYNYQAYVDAFSSYNMEQLEHGYYTIFYPH